MDEKETLKQLVESVSKIESALLGSLDGKKGIVAKVEEHEKFICGIKTMITGFVWKIVAVMGVGVFAGVSGTKLIGMLFK